MANGFKSGGRQVGTPNKTTKAVREVIEKMMTEYVNSEVFIKDLAQLEPKERLSAITKFCPFVAPKIQSVELNTKGSGESSLDEILRKLAQGEDPVLAGMILLYTDKAKKELKQQESMMLLESIGHIWIRDEVQGTTDLQREFNDYLDSFHSIICMAAQIYGFYHEIDRMADNLSGLSKQLSTHPGNAVAVALSANRNKIYREIILNSVDIVNDIRQVCLSDTKMTEKERIEIVFGIRPKLKLMNRKLVRLIKAVKYTSFADVWAEIDYHAREGADKKDIARQCMERWRRNGRR